MNFLSGPDSYDLMMLKIGTIADNIYHPQRQIVCPGAMQQSYRSQLQALATPPAANVFTTFSARTPSTATVIIHTDGGVYVNFESDESDVILRVTLQSCSWNVPSN